MRVLKFHSIIRIILSIILLESKIVLEESRVYNSRHEFYFCNNKISILETATYSKQYNPYLTGMNVSATFIFKVYGSERHTYTFASNDDWITTKLALLSINYASEICLIYSKRVDVTSRILSCFLVNACRTELFSFSNKK